MLSQFFILSGHGDTLIFRDFRGDVARGTPEIFYRKLKSFAPSDAPPIFEVEGTHFLHVVRSGLCFVCTTRLNVPPVFVLEMLHRIAALCKDYCGNLNEHAIRNNFALVYEVLDEALDFGYPQSTSTEGLKDYIFNEAHVVTRTDSNVLTVGGAAIFGSEKRTVPGAFSNQSVICGNRSSTGRSKKEIFIDILEKLTVVIGANGSTVRAEIDGRVQVKSYLVGNPEVRIQLNENIVVGSFGDDTYNMSSICLNSVGFHDCIDEDMFEKSRTLLFHPPEGEFTVMNYSSREKFTLPFRLHPFVEEVGQKDLIVSFKLECLVPPGHHALNVCLKFPVPKSTVSVSHESNSNSHSFEYQNAEKLVVWSIKKMLGGSHFYTKFRIAVSNRTSITKKEIGSVSIEFEFPMYVCSGMQIKGLRVLETNSMYTPMRWVRYITHSDSYVQRL